MIYVFIFVFTFICSNIFIIITRHLSYKYRLTLNKPIRSRDIHSKPIPCTGGIALYCTILIVFLLLKLNLFNLFNGLYLNDHYLRITFICITIVFFIGIIDDFINVNPLLKLLFQIIPAFIFVIYNKSVISIPLPFIQHLVHSQNNIIMNTISIIFIVVLINMINLIDGLDGLAVGITIITMCIFIFNGLSLFKILNPFIISNAIILSTILLSMCIAFILYNFYPSTIMLGDSGSMIIGLLIAICTITLSIESHILIDNGNFNKDILKIFYTHKLSPIYLPIISILGSLFLPIYDLFYSIIRRLLSGNNIFSPDDNHLHHRLYKQGYTHKQTVIMMYYISFIITIYFYSYSIIRLHSYRIILFIIFLIFFCINVYILISYERYKKLILWLQNIINRV